MYGIYFSIIAYFMFSTDQIGQNSFPNCKMQVGDLVMKIS